MKKHTIVITGMGAITPVGIGVKTYWNNLINGVSGIRRISSFDPSELPVQIAAEVSDFNPKDFISPKLIKEMDRFMQLAYAAAEEALADSAFSIKENASKIGIVMATAMDGIVTIAETQDAYSRGKHRVSPRFVPKFLGNIAAAQIAIAKGIHGPSYTLNTACSSGGDAISLAAMLLKAGEADAMLVIGGESTLCPIVIGSLAQAKALSRNNDHPEVACCPFDADRDGFIMGEGGGAILLETEEHALKRNAPIKAELAGYANNTDGYHVTAPAPDGSGAISCMKRALEIAELSPAEIGYINAHGTSTPVGDPIETIAIKAVFGDNAVPPVSSTKSATGHLMGAGGITETIACVEAIRNGILPPTLNYRTPDPECDLDYVPNKKRNTNITVAMTNALGFGGQNSSIIVKNY